MLLLTVMTDTLARSAISAREMPSRSATAVTISTMFLARTTPTLSFFILVHLWPDFSGIFIKLCRLYV